MTLSLRLYRLKLTGFGSSTFIIREVLLSEQDNKVRERRRKIFDKFFIYLL
tara:strand:- start:4058 stop:4210 length:153 start_codon:yes stop_codon:yes gene_type:complete